MAFQTGQPPYYDNFDPKYTKMLFRPGTSIQNGELNGIQTGLQYQMKQLGDTILKDGDILEGCELVIQDNGEAIQKTCILSAGKVYLNGLVREVKETNFFITGIGIEKIGIKLQSQIVDEFQDEGILDQASGFPNYKQSGAHRLKETVVTTLNDPDAPVLHTLQDGVLVTTKVTEDNTMLTKLNDLLAHRTFDESGNYKVWGLQLSAKPIIKPNDKYLFVTLAEGKAYIKGYELTRISSMTIPLERSTTLRAVHNEPKAFEKGKRKYRLNYTPVENITDFVATVSMTMQLTRGSILNGSDPIPEVYRPAVDIQTITQPGGKTFVKGKDFNLLSDTVDWNLNGTEPQAGESYTITFTYNRTMVPNVDYDLLLENNQYHVRLLRNYDSSFIDENGNTVNGIASSSAMLVDYNFVLYYIASITMDAGGQIRVMNGQPDVLETVAPPNLDLTEMLLLGNVLLSPKNDTLQISSVNNSRLTMIELQEMVLRLYDLEYNTAVSDLDAEAMANEEPTQLKGIYTDGFIGISKCDLFYDNKVSGIRFDSSIDIGKGELTLSATHKEHDLVVQQRSDILPVSSCRTYRRLTTAGNTETRIDRQPYATDVILINPYELFPARPSISIYPATDNWIDTENITVNQDGGVRISVDTIRDANWSGLETTSRTETTTSTHITDSAITFMRSKTIQVTAHNFGSHRNNLKVTFNGVTMSCTPSADCAGANGALKANVDGGVSCIFTVPSNTPCGTVNVEMYPIDEPSFLARTIYTAKGTKRTTTTTKTSTVFQTITGVFEKIPEPTPEEPEPEPVHPEPEPEPEPEPDPEPEPEPDPEPVPPPPPVVTRPPQPPSTRPSSPSGGLIIPGSTSQPDNPWITYRGPSDPDPIAQTFKFANSQFITKVGIYFCKKPNQSARIQIREVSTDGYPTNIVMGESVVSSINCRGSDNATAETIFQFADPVYCKANVSYCFVILTADLEASLYYEKLGGMDLTSKQQILRNPYVPGMMFSSSNALTWTAHQTDNVKFNIYGCKFNQVSYVYFRELTNIRYDRICLYASTEVPVDTEILWEYSKDSGKTWFPIAIGVEVELPAVMTKFLLRACLLSQSNVAPFIATDSVLLLGYLNNLECNYVSRNVQMDTNFTSIKQIVDIYRPTGTNVNVFYATDVNGVEWHSATQTAAKVKDTRGYIQYTFEDTIASPGVKNYRVRILMKTNNPCIRPTIRNLMNILR